MPIDVRCACGKEYHFKDEYAGRRAKCPACGQVARIPGARPAGHPSPHSPLREDRRSRTRELALLGSAGFVVLVGIGLVVYFLCFSGPAPRTPKPAAPSPATSPWSATQPAETSWPASRLYWAVRIEDGAIIVDLEDGTEAVIRPRRDALERYGVKDIEGYPSLLARKLRARGYGDQGNCLGKGDMGQTVIGLRFEFSVRLSDIATIKLRKR